MKIGLDLRMLGGGSGISRYISELSQNILTLDKKNQYVLFFNELDIETRKNFEKFGHKMVETGIPHYSVSEQIKLPGILKKEDLDLMHFPHFNVPILYNRKFIVTIHDLTHTKFPGRKKSHMAHRLAYNAVMLNAVKRAVKIIAVSQATKNEVKQYFSVPDERIQVIYEGFSDSFKIMDREVAWKNMAVRFGLHKPFLLYVGVWRRYKNLPVLAKVFDRLVEAGHDLDLVLVGDADPFYPEIKEQIFSIKHKDRIKAVGRVTDNELNNLYNACLVFVLPSLAEGFGLITLEASACGAPIAASDIPTLREVLGQGAEFFDPNNLDNMFDVLHALVDNHKRLEDLANSGLARSKHFSWKQAAEETIKLYESA